MAGMAIGVSPQRLREVRFAEQWRGYRTDEVDEFVERVAEAFDQLEERLSEAAERAARAERRLLERSPADDLSRTLVLAQRTADAALREAESESARLLADADERARATLAEAEARVARFDAEIEQRAESELGDLVERRRSLESDVARLTDYVKRQRGRLCEELRAHLRWLEDGVHLEPVPEISSEPAPAIDRPYAGVGAEAVEADVTAEPAPDGPPPPTDAGASDEGAADDDALATATATDGGVFDRDQPGDEGALPGDDTVLDDLDAQGIMWREPNGDTPDGSTSDDVSEPAPVDDDPFLAELRRAVDDPEPLGPRDDAEEWPNDTGLYDDSTLGPARFRRRRRQR